jgi:hypothetical protein
MSNRATIHMADVVQGFVATAYTTFASTERMPIRE